MKKTFIILFCCSMIIFACNGSGSSTTTAGSDTAASPATAAPAAPDSASAKALDLIGSSDCTTCHRLQQSSAGASIGPAYSDVAAKYAPAADSTVNRLVNKIIHGGKGVWGDVPMTPHGALSEADVKEMVTYILSLKK